MVVVTYISNLVNAVGIYCKWSGRSFLQSSAYYGSIIVSSDGVGQKRHKEGYLKYSSENSTAFHSEFKEHARNLFFRGFSLKAFFS